ncbi:ATP-dependent DNA helicase [Trichonephila clavipes]|nr:ATP-dependent DNA helicase [Trichonephila clavipes]
MILTGKTNLRHNYTDHAWLIERAILAAKNLDVDAINFKIHQSLPGKKVTFKSNETVVDPDGVVNFNWKISRVEGRAQSMLEESQVYCACFCCV